MVRSTDIKNGLLHLVGWQQNYDTTKLKIADDLVKSESGLYFQQFHPLLTLDNLSSLAPDFNNANYPEYDAGRQYYTGNVVTKGDSTYKALQDTKGQDPGSSPEYWAPTTPFSDWLQFKTEASIQKAVMQLCNDKVANGTLKTLCENKILFTGTGRICDTVKNRNHLAGFEIVPVRSNGITTKINKIGLQFTKPGDYTLYLMHSSSEKPIKTISLTKKQGNTLEWFTQDDLYLPYVSESTDAGGSWYLCYKQSELPEGSEAIRKDRDWSKGPCGSCSRIDFVSWQAWSKYIEVHPFYVSEEQVTSLEDSIGLWDVANNVYTYNTNYGINLEVTVACDITDFIIEQRSLFSNIIGLQLAVDFLREFAYNPNVRTNRHIMNASKTDILYEIDGDSASLKKSGLAYQLDQAFKAVSLSLKGIDRVCLPCKNNGLKYVSI